MCAEINEQNSLVLNRTKKPINLLCTAAWKVYTAGSEVM
jgi:hypothetical protein